LFWARIGLFPSDIDFSAKKEYNKWLGSYSKNPNEELFDNK
jgi:hypothetical protein